MSAYSFGTSPAAACRALPTTQECTSTYVKMVCDDGPTALHIACLPGAPEEVNKMLIRRGPKAVATIKQPWPYPASLRLCWRHYIAQCRQARDESVVNCPSPSNTVRDSHLDRAERGQRQDEVIEFLSEATRDTACAFIDVTLIVKTDAPSAVITHVKKTVEAIAPTIQGSDAVLSHSFRSQLQRPVLQRLLDNEELQTLRKNKRYQSLVHGFFA
jgi:hypothetical protein